MTDLNTALVTSIVSEKPEAFKTEGGTMGVAVLGLPIPYRVFIYFFLEISGNHKDDQRGFFKDFLEEFNLLIAQASIHDIVGGDALATVKTFIREMLKKLQEDDPKGENLANAIWRVDEAFIEMDR